MNNNTSKFIIIILGLILSPNIALPIQNLLKYSCNFLNSADPGGLHKPKPLTLEFIVDEIAGKAVMVGNNGFSDVQLVEGIYGKSFIEYLPTGAVQTTTIAKQTLNSVHSRHSLIGGDDLIPSQYYGKCSIPSER